ncbi:MAG TPA: metal-dependent hydrolase [Candidatus Angelobacter sp.]|nr:metal-dependent hydrolase [Candidatus Angelobacter sp.]
MDPVTHLLTGACLGRAGLNRKTGLATLTLTLTAEAPDLDVIAYFWGPVAGLQHHRGFTHALIGIPLVGIAVLAAVYGIYRFRSRSGWQPELPPRWALLFGYGCLAAAIHLLQDLTNNYGVRPFTPFYPRWYSGDLVFIIDPLMLLALFLGLVLPSLFSLISEEVGAKKGQFRGAGGARFALICLAALISLRALEHSRAITLLQSLTYRGEDAVRVSAFPNPLNFFAWNGVVETKDFFELLPVESNAGEVDPHNLAVVQYKPQETAVTLAAKKSYLGRVYLDWAEYPLVRQSTLEGNRYLVTFTDLRFTTAEALRRRRSSPLTGYVILDSALRVVQEGTGAPEPD